jgi:hypothetical protein
VILKWIIKKVVGWAWNGLIWLRTGVVDETLDFVRSREYSDNLVQKGSAPRSLFINLVVG